MKKNILGVIAFVAALVVALPSQAQIKFGLKGGLNVNKVDTEAKFLGISANPNDKNTSGFFVGVTADVTIPLAGLGADISLLYDQKKMKYEYEGVSDSKTLQYISIPINAKYTVGFSSLASVYVATGPQFSYNVGGKRWGDLSDEGYWELKKSELSWNIGAGATVLSHVRVGYNYNIGLGKTGEAKALGIGKDVVSGKLKNNTHQVSVTYLF